MEQGEEAQPVTPREVIAERVRQARIRHGWSARHLAQRLADLGMPSLDRSTLAKIEAGQRQRIGVDELLALATALSVSPISLLTPVDDNAPYQVTPERALWASWVRAWIRGYRPLPFADRRMYFSEVPASEWVEHEPSEEELARRDRERERLRSLRESGGDGGGT